MIARLRTRSMAATLLRAATPAEEGRLPGSDPTRPMASACTIVGKCLS